MYRSHWFQNLVCSLALLTAIFFVSPKSFAHYDNFFAHCNTDTCPDVITQCLESPTRSNCHSHFTTDPDSSGIRQGYVGSFFCESGTTSLHHHLNKAGIIPIGADQCIDITTLSTPNNQNCSISGSAAQQSGSCRPSNCSTGQSFSCSSNGSTSCTHPGSIAHGLASAHFIGSLGANVNGVNSYYSGQSTACVSMAPSWAQTVTQSNQNNLPTNPNPTPSPTPVPSPTPSATPDPNSGGSSGGENEGETGGTGGSGSNPSPTPTPTTGTGGTGSGTGGSGESTASGGGTCDEAPVCDGDPIQCETLKQQWRTRCAIENETISALTDCTVNFECDGDAIDCARARLAQEQYCSLEQYKDLTAEDVFADEGLTNIDNMQTGEAWSEDITENIDDDVTGLVSSITNAATGVTASCPADENVSFGSLGNFTVTYSGLCTLATTIRPLVIALAVFFSLYGLVKVMRGTD